MFLSLNFNFLLFDYKKKEMQLCYIIFFHRT